MRHTVLGIFLFAAILGLGCMGVVTPGKADGLKHPINLGMQCAEYFEEFLDWDSRYKVFAYVIGLRGYACSYKESTREALAECNLYRKGECKVYAKSPVNGKVAIVWQEHKKTARLLAAKKAEEAEKKRLEELARKKAEDKERKRRSDLARNAENGDATAQYKLGVFYRTGDNVPQNYKTALKWLRLSAEQGNVAAQFSLGNMYETGQGVPEDHNTALKWYTLAADQGDKFAKMILANAKWQKLAAEQATLKAIEEKKALAKLKAEAEKKRLAELARKKAEEEKARVLEEAKAEAEKKRLAEVARKKAEEEKARKLVQAKAKAEKKRQAEQARKIAEAEKKRQEELAKAQKQIELEKADYKGKLLFTVRRVENFLKNSFEKDDAGKIISVDTKVGCEYFFRISNYTDEKIFVNRFTINTDKKASFKPADRKTLVSIGGTINPGQSIEKQSQTIISRWLPASRKTAPDESQQAAAISKYGCEAQAGSVYISFGNTKEFIKFSKKRRISKRKIKKLISGNDKGATPLRVVYE